MVKFTYLLLLLVGVSCVFSLPQRESAAKSESKPKDEGLERITEELAAALKERTESRDALIEFREKAKEELFKDYLDKLAEKSEDEEFDLGSFLEGVKEAVKEKFEFLKGAYEKAKEKVKEVIGEAVKAIKEGKDEEKPKDQEKSKDEGIHRDEKFDFSELIEKAKEVLGKVGAEIKAKYEEVKDKVKEVVAKVAKAIEEGDETALEASNAELAKALKESFELAGALQEHEMKSKDVLAELSKGVGSEAEDESEEEFSFSNFFEEIKEGVKKGVAKAKEIFEKAKEKAKEIYGKVKAKVHEVIEEITGKKEEKDASSHIALHIMKGK